MMSIQQTLVFLVAVLVLSISDVSGFSVNLKSHRVTSSTRLGMVTGYRGKPALSKQDDLEKTVSLILKHDEKMNSSGSSSSKLSRKSASMSTAEPINGDKDESRANAEEGKEEKVSKLKRFGRALKFWKK